MLERHGAVTRIVLDRPSVMNRFEGTMREDLLQALEGVGGDTSVRAVLITGAGDHFSAGADIEELVSLHGRGAHDEIRRRVELGAAVVRTIRAMTKPVVAAVDGNAAGAGMNLALACDMRIASTAAKFSQAFVKRGLAPDWGGTFFLPRVVGVAKACELIFTGDSIDAAKALELGIVNAVVAPEALMDEAYKLAGRIAAGPPVAIALAKRAIYHNQDVDLRAALEFETFAQTVCRETEDSKEGVKAFLEKRAPVFKGR